MKICHLYCIILIQVVTSLDEISKLTERTDYFGWASAAMVHTVFDRNAEYKAGSVIWTVYNHLIVPFGN